MRILAISSWWPEPANNGSRIRISRLLRALTQEHEVHLAALAQEPVQEEQITRVREWCASVATCRQREWSPSRAALLASLWRNEPASVRATWNPAFDALVRERYAAARPDVVIAFELSAAPYARRIPGVPRLIEDIEVIAYRDAVVKARSPRQRLRAWLTWTKYRGYLAQVLRDFNACTVVSAEEQALLRTIAPRTTPVLVTPNGTDIDDDSTWGEPEPDTLIYPGALSFDANYDAVAHFLSAIFPIIRAARPQVRLRVTGRSTPEQRAGLPQVAGVEFTGYVPDVRPLIARTWCEVVPLRVGSGTRLKVLEAMALGTPVVSTSKGVEGLDVRHEHDVLVADEPEAFAAETLRVLADPALRIRLASVARTGVRRRYDWRAIGQEFASLVHSTTTAAIAG